MRILTVEDSAKIVDVLDLSAFFGVEWLYPDPVPSYFLPKDSGAKVGLARLIANTFIGRGQALLWITETGVWGSLEHMELFDRYRLSYGEARTVAEAPIHIFETGDRDAFISIVAIGLFFGWDFEILSLDRSLAMTISHDEWLEYRFAPGHEAFVYEFKKWIEPSLRQEGAVRP